ncbi:unnamed protein product [Blepharisma stoltei]|uniref:Uncharacterized protein n=1 Tax=Blepharisma stoltei TaxID=1481888 RepID=A0AAU9JV08_9CILI|nr:unnamed protein product [Blepharisma stoltei]
MGSCYNTNRRKTSAYALKELSDYEKLKLNSRHRFWSNKAQTAPELKLSENPLLLRRKLRYQESQQTQCSQMDLMSPSISSQYLTGSLSPELLNY